MITGKIKDLVWLQKYYVEKIEEVKMELEVYRELLVKEQ